MKDWLPDLTTASGPKFLAIADALERDIAAGRLPAGTRLPPQRALAEGLGVDLTTVTRGYGEAQRRGILGSEGRRGSFVLSPPASTSVDLDGPVETGMNAPPVPAGNALAEAWRSATDILMSQGHIPPPFHYQPSGGMASVRAAGASLLHARGMPCAPETVVVTAGGQNGLHAIVSTAFRPGDTIAVAPFTYPGFLSLARRYGLRLVAVPADENGILPDGLAQMCRSENIAGLYVIPTNDNPTTATMDLPRRAAIAEVAASQNLLVIEDDAYGLLPEVATPSLASLVPERTFHICSVSKVISPGLRVAWVRTPDIGSAWRLCADLHETAIMAPPFNAAVVSVWLETGDFWRLADAVRCEVLARNDIVAETLEGGSYRARPCGYHLWLPLPSGRDPSTIIDVLRPYGLSLSASDAFAVAGTGAPPAMRVSTGGLITRQGLRSALTLLREMTGDSPVQKVSLV
ncbi:PLP-dependent aminotransferase family protein [Croceicoccus sp. BE223]|uniref:aminotransferase-like domain-containing protein n=1 Tax=Croceicoccus sp. BE223 TaxID=2817716 RepID=UPI00285FD38D|nr:PLP-dependent aminotransferase family protein [Croceicoccus sp. BE223]MDR7101550.1 DNA-binding transcriptional MocR family regulator [Croceicoccus sp. BE223]